MSKKKLSSSFLYRCFIWSAFLNFFCAFTMFNIWFTSNISKSWLSYMQFKVELVSSWQNLLTILFIFNFIQLIVYWSSNLLASWFLMKFDFLFPQITQFGTSINPFYFVLLSVECLGTSIFCNWCNMFPLHKTKQNQATLFIMGQYFLKIFFIAFDFILISDLYSNLNNLMEILSRVF